MTRQVKLELKGYVLYSNTFNITVTECEHPGYDMSTGKCTQCGCDLAAAIVKGETTRGYVNFYDALTATQTDENKGCVLWLLTDVTKKITVSAGDFKFGIKSHTIGVLNVTKAAYLKTLSAGTHTLSVVSRNGQADTTFTIEKERKNNSPKTGENNDVVMWIALLFISSGVMTGIGAAKKSKKKK